MANTNQITWHIQSDEYGMHSTESWWLTEGDKQISPIVPSETGNIGDEVNHYTKGRKVDRILRTKVEHKGEYRLFGRGFDGRADHFIAIECSCAEHAAVAV